MLCAHEVEQRNRRACRPLRARLELLKPEVLLVVLVLFKIGSVRIDQ
jgi:hypothetical protein